MHALFNPVVDAGVFEEPGNHDAPYRASRLNVSRYTDILLKEVDTSLIQSRQDNPFDIALKDTSRHQFGSVRRELMIV